VFIEFNVHHNYFSDVKSRKRNENQKSIVTGIDKRSLKLCIFIYFISISHFK